MEINKVIFFGGDYEFKLPSSVEIPEDFIEIFRGQRDRLLIYILFKLICEKPNEVLKGLIPDDSSM